MQYFGSGICSHSLTILSANFFEIGPFTNSTSDCLGDERNKTPNLSPSNLGVAAAAISIAQHFIPKWSVKSDFLPAQLKNRPASTLRNCLIRVALSASSVTPPTISTNARLLNAAKFSPGSAIISPQM